MSTNLSTNIPQSSSRELPFKTALAHLKSFHDLEMEENDFEEVAYIAWRKIGNREKVRYLLVNQQVTEVTNDDGSTFARFDLPCNAYDVEGVTIDFTNFDELYYAAGSISYGDYYGYYVNRLSAKARVYQPGEMRGEFIPFEVMTDGAAKFVSVDSNITEINILYNGLRVDSEGLPMLSEKEALAISWYCAYTLEHRRLIKRQGGDGNLVQYLKQESDRHVRDARVQEKFTQNHMDSLLNVKVSMNRKWYNQSLRWFQDV